MKYWLDKDSEKKNLVILSRQALLLASVDKESQERVVASLEKNTHPKEVFGDDGYHAFPFSMMEGITSRSTDVDLDIVYKTKKETDNELIFFNNCEDKLECLGLIEKLLLKNESKLQKKEHQQSVFTAILNPLLSFILALGATYLFFNKVRLIALVVGGIWAAASLFILVGRLKNPPKITRWVTKGRYAKKTWGALKTAYTYGFIGIAIIAGYFSMPATHGPASLYEAIQINDLDGGSVTTYLENGADINYKGSDGSTPLISALNYSEENLAVALVKNGAQLTSKYEGQTPLDLAIESSMDKAVASMLDAEAKSANNKDVLMRSILSELNMKNIQRIVKLSDNINYKNEEGLPALGVAILYDSEVDVVKYLLEQGADTNFQINELTPLEFSKKEGKTELEALLKEK